MFGLTALSCAPPPAHAPALWAVLPVPADPGPAARGLTWLLFRQLRCVVSAPRRRRRRWVRTRRPTQGVVGGPGRDRDLGWSRPCRTHTAARAYLGIGPDTGPAAMHIKGRGWGWSRLRRSHTQRRGRTSAPVGAFQEAGPARRKEGHRRKGRRGRVTAKLCSATAKLCTTAKLCSGP